MSLRCARTVLLSPNYSKALVPVFLLRSSNASPKMAAVSGNQSSNFRLCSSYTAPSDATEKKRNSVNFSVLQIFEDWKNKLLPKEEVSSTVDAPEKTTPSAIDEASTTVVETTSPSPSAIDLALTSVVKVFTVSSQPRLFQPWQISMESGGTGSGFVISGKKILTNAHVVANYTSVKVRKHGSSTKFKAKVRAIGHECDLAILEVDNEEFWEGMNLLEFGDIPSLQQDVFVVGYPEGGDTISVTKGVVSRVEMRGYCHSGSELMAIQVDAAINHGNSGGPVIMGNKVAGVAFQGLSWSDGIGYIIPTPVINRFLEGVEKNGQHVSFGSIDIKYQNMMNPKLRQSYGMKTGMTGILIQEINPLSDAHKFLKTEDVILAIDGVPIGNDCTGEITIHFQLNLVHVYMHAVPFRKEETINFKHLVSMKKPSDTALFKVLREGKVLEFNICVKPVQPLVPVHNYEKHLSYYIYGGLVFVPLTQPYIERIGMSEEVLKKMPTKAGEEIVIVSQIIEDDITTGYEDCEDLQVEQVNGVKVENLKHLCQLMEEGCNGLLKLRFEHGMVVTLDHRTAKKVTAKILRNLKIPSAMSDDLQPKQRNRCHKPRRTKKD